jgi:large subunit ribosomal protein L10
MESLCPARARQRLFIPTRKGGETTLAISKERKQELVTQYGDWASRSQALIITEYKGLTMKDVDAMRKRLREVGGEFHIVKNTLVSLALEKAGMPLKAEIFEGSTAVCFAFEDAPATAKALLEYTKGSEIVKIKGGYLGKSLMTAENVKALADMPPLPVMRAQLLGVLLAPASKLARTLAEPARALAAVVKAYAEPAAASEPVAG